MKKFIFILALALVSISANAQIKMVNESPILTNAKPNPLLEEMCDMVKGEVYINNLLRTVEGYYTLTYQTPLDAETIYNKLMTQLSFEEKVFINKYENTYRIKVIEENGDETYKIWVKDGAVKFEGNLNSKRAYNPIISVSDIYIKTPKWKIGFWAYTIKRNLNDDFDF